MERLRDDELGLVMKRVSYPNDRKACSEVSKKWWKAKSLTRSSIYVINNAEFLARLLSKYPNLLDFNADGFISDLDLLNIANTYPNLEVLDLQYFPSEYSTGGIGDDVVCVVANIFHRLKNVSLSNRQVRDRGVIALVQLNPHLSHLDLDSCYIHDEALQANAVTAPFLQVLKLANCDRVTHMGFLALARGVVSQTLKELFIGGWDNVIDETLEAIAETSLHVLDLSGCSPSITDFGLIALAQGTVSRTLKKLVLEQCLNISDQGVEASDISLERDKS